LGEFVPCAAGEQGFEGVGRIGIGPEFGQGWPAELVGEVSARQFADGGEQSAAERFRAGWAGR
jgi:hypothetical protein